MVKNLPANAGDVRDTDSIPGLEDPLEEGMATYSRILAWTIPLREEPGRLQSMGSQSQTRLKRLNTHTGTVDCTSAIKTNERMLFPAAACARR